MTAPAYRVFRNKETGEVRAVPGESGATGIFKGARIFQNKDTGEKVTVFKDGTVEPFIEPEQQEANLKVQQAEPGYMETIGKGAVRGFEGMASGVGSATRWLGEATGADAIAKAGDVASDYWNDAAHKGWARPNEYVNRGTFLENPSLKRATGIVAEAVPSLLAALVAGVASGGGTVGAAVGAGALGLLDGGAPQYEAAREKGKSIGEASAYGAMSTIGTAVLEYLPISRILGRSGKFYKRAAQGSIEEGVQEPSQRLWQNLIAKYGYDETVKLTDGIIESIIGGTGAGGIAGAVFGRGETGDNDTGGDKSGDDKFKDFDQEDVQAATESIVEQTKVAAPAMVENIEAAEQEAQVNWQKLKQSALSEVDGLLNSKKTTHGMAVSAIRQYYEGEVFDDEDLASLMMKNPEKLGPAIQGMLTKKADALIDSVGGPPEVSRTNDPSGVIRDRKPVLDTDFADQKDSVRNEAKIKQILKRRKIAENNKRLSEKERQSRLDGYDTKLKELGLDVDRVGMEQRRRQKEISKTAADYSGFQPNPKSNIPEDLRETMFLMRDEALSSQSRGTSRDADGSTTGFAASSPPWMRELNSSKEHKPFSRKEIETLVNKAETDKPLTLKQEARYNILLDAARKFKKDNPDLAAADDQRFVEDKGYQFTGEQKMVEGDLKPGDKFYGTLDGVEDEYEHKGFDDNGDAIIQDGVTKHVDTFDQVKIEGIKPKFGQFSKAKSEEEFKRQQKTESRIDKEIREQEEVTDSARLAGKEPAETSKEAKNLTLWLGVKAAHAKTDAREAEQAGVDAKPFWQTHNLLKKLSTDISSFGKSSDIAKAEKMYNAENPDAPIKSFEAEFAPKPEMKDEKTPETPDSDVLVDGADNKSGGVVGDNPMEISKEDFIANQKEFKISDLQKQIDGIDKGNTQDIFPKIGKAKLEQINRLEKKISEIKSGKKTVTGKDGKEYLVEDNRLDEQFGAIWDKANQPDLSKEAIKAEPSQSDESVPNYNNQLGSLPLGERRVNKASDRRKTVESIQEEKRKAVSDRRVAKVEDKKIDKSIQKSVQENNEDQNYTLQEPKAALNFELKKPEQLELSFGKKKTDPIPKTVSATPGRVVMRRTGEISSSGTVVQNAADAAAVVSHIGKLPQEYGFAITTDKKGTVLEVHSYSKGTSGSASIKPEEISGPALDHKSAKNIYFIHNHPGGSLEASDNDLRIFKVLSAQGLLQDAVVQNVIVAGDRYSLHGGESGKIPNKIKKQKLPVKERRYLDNRAAKDPTGKSITPEMKSKALREGMPLFQTSAKISADTEKAKTFTEKYFGKNQRFSPKRFREDTLIDVPTLNTKDLNRATSSFQTPFDLARNYPAIQNLFKVEQESKAKAHQITSDDRDTTKAYFDLDKTAKGKVNKALLAGDERGAVLKDAVLKNKRFGLNDKEIAAYRSIRQALDSKLKIIVRTQLGAALPEGAAITDELMQMLTKAKTVEEIKNRLKARYNLADEQVGYISHLANWIKQHKGYVPHKWAEPWRVKVTVDGKEYLLDVPTMGGKIGMSHNMREALAKSKAIAVVREKFGWSTKDIESAGRNTRTLFKLREKLKKAEGSENQKDAKNLKSQIDLLEKENHFLVVNSKKTPLELFHGARYDVMMNIVNTATDFAWKDMDEMSGKNMTAKQKADLTGIKDAISENIKKLYLAKGGLQHLIGRKGVKGYRTDLENVLAEYIVGMNALIAKHEKAKEFASVFADIKPNKPRLWKHSRQYIEDMLGESNEAGWFKKLAGGTFLAGDLSAATLNATQNWTHAVAALRRIIPKKNKKIAEKEIFEAMRDVFNEYKLAHKEKRTMFSTGKTEADKTMRRLMERGLFDPEMLGEVTGFHKNELFDSRNIQNYLYKAFTGVETMNRLSTALAAYRRCVNAGMGVKQAQDQAINTVYASHFAFGRGNRPEIIRKTGALGNIAFTFMAYPMGNLTFIKHNIESALESAHKGDKAALRTDMKVIGSNLAYLLAFGGVKALPFVWLAQAASNLFDDDDEEFETMIRRAIPGKPGRALSRGIPSLIGNDMSWRIQGTDVVGLPIGFQVAQMGKRRVEQSMDLWGQNEHFAAAMHLMPDMIRNPWKAYVGYVEGGEKRGAPPVKYTRGEAAWKALGFTPTREAEVYDIASQTKTKRRLRLSKLEDFAEEFIRVSKEKDLKAMGKLRKAVREYNKKEFKKGRRGVFIKWKDVVRSAKTRYRHRSKGYTESLPKYMQRFQKQIQKEYGVQ